MVILVFFLKDTVCFHGTINTLISKDQSDFYSSCVGAIKIPELDETHKTFKEHVQKKKEATFIWCIYESYRMLS